MINSKNCCGCMACKEICAHGAIDSTRDENGFENPILNKELCVNCGLCDTVCPGRQHSCSPKMPKAYAIRLISEKKRSQSQSGGAFTAISEYILNLGGVVYGVFQDKDLKVKYKRVEACKELGGLKGSKYVQAINDGIFTKAAYDIKQGRHVLFCGTPCFADGLLKYLEARKCSTEKLVVCDIVCHGVPSPGIYEEYIRLLKNKQGNQIKSFIFRDKRFGWRRNISTYNVKNRNMVTSNYINIFESQCCLREICYECPYASLNRVGDLTIGDYWGIEKIHPEWDDNTGVSLLLISTQKGREVFENITGECYAVETKVEDCLQPNLQQPTKKPAEYDLFWMCYKTEGFESAIRKYCNYNPNEDWERLEKIQVFRRIRSKFNRIIKRKGL